MVAVRRAVGAGGVEMGRAEGGEEGGRVGGVLGTGGPQGGMRGGEWRAAEKWGRRREGTGPGGSGAR